ncbi:MAG TPA: amidase [Pyrinomonadaceae bacterium]|nr:amidase [Pyrinomonadaceae bacterium]
MTCLTSHSAVELAELIRTRAASPVEIAEAYLRRIDAINPKLNAVVTLAPDVLERAREAEASVMRGDELGPLHGLPVTVKDGIYTAGLRTTSGTRLRADHVPRLDAPAVARLKAAGAIILGKTNLSELMMFYTTDNPVFGRTNNPHDLSRTAGGSSGGEGAAVAACLSAAGLAADGAGSIRIPSHFCGVAGLKPTIGRVVCSGQFPPTPGYSVIGPLARRVQDLHLLFQALVGEQGAPPVGGSGALLERAGSMRGRRAAWYADDTVTPVTEETRQAVELAARALSDAGFVVEERRPPGVERGPEVWQNLFSRAGLVYLRDLYAGREHMAGMVIQWLLLTADGMPKPALDEYLRFWIERDDLTTRLDEWMSETPLLIAPVAATPAFAHDAQQLDVAGQTLPTLRAFGYCPTFNVYDLPSVCVPAAFTPGGLPIGVQIVGRRNEEESVLAAAAVVEEALGGWRPPKLSADAGKQSAGL